LRAVPAVPALKPAVPLALEAAAAKASIAEEPGAGWAKAKGAGRVGTEAALPNEKVGCGG
jgi:hypothetical protein